MKISDLMKDYLDTHSEKQRGINRRLLSESFTDVHIDLPVSPVENKWTLASAPERLLRKYEFKSIEQRSMFIEEVLSLEESSGHFAKITIEGLSVLIEVWTHDLNRVTELDKEYASDCDVLFSDVSLIGFKESYEY